MTKTLTTKDIGERVRATNPQLFAALSYHRTHRGKKLDFESFPSLKAIYADDRPKGCSLKSTQGGISEFLLCKGVAHAGSSRNVFWVLPTYTLVARFVRERFDRTMAATEQYRQMVSQVDAGRFADSTTMKQFGNGTIAFVGSNTASAFTEFPADTLIVDELDQCDAGNVVMAWERLSASESPSEWYISNPTITGYGIDIKYAESTQGRWHIKCPSCGKWQHPTFIGNVVKQIDDHDYLILDQSYEMETGAEPAVVCTKCGGVLDRYSDGVWVEKYPKREMAGYHYNKLFTARVSVSALLERFVRSEGDETLRQRVWNADFGLAYNAPGARITREGILEARGQYRAGEVVPGAVVMGVDVGSYFHCVVGIVRPEPHPLRVVDTFSVRDPEQVRDKMREWKPRAFVIDALPETRVSRNLAGSTRNGYVCYFGNGKADILSKGSLTVNRTSVLDSVKAAIVQKTIEFPQGIENVDDFVDHMTASTRVFVEGANGGEGAYVWQEGSKPDHYLLATTYMVLAARMLIMATTR